MQSQNLQENGFTALRRSLNLRKMFTQIFSHLNIHEHTLKSEHNLKLRSVMSAIFMNFLVIFRVKFDVKTWTVE